MSTEVAVIKPRSVTIDMATRYGMEPAAFEATVRATVIKEASREEFAAFLLVAKEYNLNPLTKEIYAFKAKGGGIVPMVSVDGWISLVNSHKACDGFEFDMNHDDEGRLVSCTCRMYRKDRNRPVVVTEYLSECKRPTDPWKMEHRMLRHKTLVQAARYAFGFSGIYDEDEGQRILEAQASQHPDEPAAPATPTKAPAPPPIEEAKPAETVTEQVEDGEFTEATEETAKVETSDFPGDRPMQTAPKPPAEKAKPIDLDLPFFLDAKVTGPEKDWIRGLDEAFRECKDAAELHSEQESVMLPAKDHVSERAWAHAEKILRSHVDRLEGE